jgi:predicted porin
MKKTLIALAAVAATGAAFAQSTVTLSGVLDVGVKNVNQVKPGAATTSVGSGNNNRLAFSVSEDLGGGMKAIANAQMRFDPTTGTPEAAAARPLFQGETRVGLTGGFGTVMLGRGLTALQAPNGGNSDPFGVSTVAGSVYAAGFATDYAAGGEGRIDQAVWYTAPSFGGVTVSGSFSPRKLVAAGSAATADSGGVQGTNAVTAITSTKTHMSLNALYANGPLVAALGYEQNRVGDKITQVYGNYDLGVAKLFASYATVKGGTAADRAGVTFAAASSAVNTGSSTSQVAADGKIKNWTVGAVVPMGALSIRGGYSQWNGNGAAGQKDDNKLGLGVKYDLSKRTYVYSDVASQTRKNNSFNADNSKSNTKVTSFDVGVAHSF